MIDNLQNAAPIQATGLGGSSNQLNGIDLLSSIQLLLVQDYDNQMRSLGKQIKGTTKIKEAYRKDIEANQNLLTRPVVTKKSDGKDVECIEIDGKDQYDQLCGKPNDYIYDDAQSDKPNGGVVSRPSTNLDTIKPTATNLQKLQDDYKKKHGSQATSTPLKSPVQKGSVPAKVLVKKPPMPKDATVYYVAKDAIGSRIESLKLKLESLNEQSELNGLSLQSLTNQRKIAFETISNLVNKQSESMSTMVRNLKG